MSIKTLDEVYDLIESLNNDAHSDSWDSWIAADDEDDYETAEEMREDASDEQAEYFREYFWELSEEDIESVRHWLEKDEDFREQFETWFGRFEFEEEFGSFENKGD